MVFYRDTDGRTVQTKPPEEGTPEVVGAQYQLQFGEWLTELYFQVGTGVSTDVINGITNEMLLALLIHRTEHLDMQRSCSENKLALMAMRQALAAFEARAQRVAIERANHLEPAPEVLPPAEAPTA